MTFPEDSHFKGSIVIQPNIHDTFTPDYIEAAHYEISKHLAHRITKCKYVQTSTETGLEIVVDLYVFTPEEFRQIVRDEAPKFIRNGKALCTCGLPQVPMNASVEAKLDAGYACPHATTKSLNSLNSP